MLRSLRIWCILLILPCLLSGCGTSIEEPYLATRITIPTQPPTTEPSTEPPTEPTTEPEPLHSELYIPGLDVEDVILYFNEVCLDAEFENSGDASVVQKWMEPIQYTLHGDYTEEDLATLNGFVEWLNTIEGFPSMEPALDSYNTNLNIHFCSENKLLDIMGEDFGGTDGAVTFWYDEDVIYDAVICYRTDLDQYVRNSVILEEIYNGLGPIQDTSLREDSIIWADYSEPQQLTEIDELILKLLYHPEIQCGMTADECEIVIRELYY